MAGCCGDPRRQVAEPKRVAHPLSSFDKGWGIAERPFWAWVAMRLVEENGPSTTLRTCYRKRYPTLSRNAAKGWATRICGATRRSPRPRAPVYLCHFYLRLRYMLIRLLVRNVVAVPASVRCVAFELSDDLLREHLAELYAPLVEGVDVPDDAYPAWRQRCS